MYLWISVLNYPWFKNIHVDILGFLWISMWVSLDFYGYPCGYRWISKDIHVDILGFLWISMWMSLDFYGSIWISLDFYGYPYGIPWMSMDIHALTCYGFSIQSFKWKIFLLRHIIREQKKVSSCKRDFWLVDKRVKFVVCFGAQFGGSEAIITALSDEFPAIGRRRELFVLALFSLYFIVGLASCSQVTL